MALRLSIMGSVAGETGVRSRWTFGVNGGRIGRASDNDWVLLDDERYISAHHAEVEHRAGEWWIRDLSTNGTFVNGSRRPLGIGGRHQIVDGDRIRVGSIELVAEITGSNDFPPDEEFDLSETALDSSFEVKSLLSAEPRGGKARAADAYGQPLPERPAAPARRPALRSESAAPKPIPEAPRTPDDNHRGLWPGLVAFCQGAGIDVYEIPAPARATLLQEVGQAMREMMLGLMELARARAEFTREMGISGSQRKRDATSPLMQVRAVEEALTQLLAGNGSAETRALDEVRTQFAKTRHHQQSILVALREALPAMLERIDPQELEQQAGGRAPGSADAQARCWTLYCEMHKSIVEPGDLGLPPAFAEEFARAYSALSAVGLRATATADASG